MKITFKEQSREAKMGSIITIDGEPSYMIVPSIVPNSKVQKNKEFCVLLRLDNMTLVSDYYDNPAQLAHSEFNGTPFQIKNIEEIVVV